MAGETSHGPMHQFEVHPIVPIDIAGFDISFTNASLWMVLAVLSITLLLGVGIRSRAMVPGRMQSIAELSYEFIANMLRENVGSGGRQFFPFIFTLFMFIITCNVFGMLPYSFTVTSHIVVTFAIAILCFFIVIGVGIARHGLHFFSLFLPSGLPLVMAPLMLPIELISFLARPFTLSVRLSANMLAGHAMMKVIAGFVLTLGWMLGWMPFLFLVVLTGFEIFVAILQAYIFTILVCVYLNDAVNLH
jgi:F-type H+-transporting ATPase subunit a